MDSLQRNTLAIPEASSLMLLELLTANKGGVRIFFIPLDQVKCKDVWCPVYPVLYCRFLAEPLGEKKKQKAFQGPALW